MPAPIPFPRPPGSRPTGAPHELQSVAPGGSGDSSSRAPADGLSADGPSADRPPASTASRAAFNDGAAYRLRLRDLSLRPTPMFFVLLMPVPPLLVAALGFGSIAAAVLSTVLLAVAFGCVWRCVQTLRGLGLRFSSPAPCFAGDTAMLELRIANPASRNRWDIGVGIEGPVARGPSDWVDVAPYSYSLATLKLPTRERGPMALPTIRIETEHPFGVVQAWARWTPETSLLVFPRPEMDAPPPPASSRGRDGLQRLDPAGAGLAEECSAGAFGGEAGRPGVEAAASRLTAWVLRAERSQTRYGLRLGALIVPPGRGLPHRRRCLELLARWDGAPSHAWTELFPSQPGGSALDDGR